MYAIRFLVQTRPWYWLRRYALRASLDGGQTYRPVAFCWTRDDVSRQADRYARWMTYWDRV